MMMTLPSVTEMMAISRSGSENSGVAVEQKSKVAEQMKLSFVLNPVVSSPAVSTSACDQVESAPSPVCMTSSSDKKTRVRWTPAEDELLIQLVHEHGARRWDKLAEHFENRKGSQLRSRWSHRLADMSSCRPFTATEDEWILKGYSMYGASWKRIADQMERRLSHDVLNRCKLLLKRQNSCASLGSS
mmetsp:Transcript_17186/g.37406  ORF Transcript_17186/g.37406 Transcript_17186/m.37406 type:complete len:187 (+) Transcript_17186:332-892(+)|eukprot:CAMPEP_0185843716 /NCGR_PEP_ID=MMETSP1354-20130828/132_1 /TAXON_ID=708628 /ORGANISM="Erythrolobus madagascarensis, Strain CCMP3276" /LENGTH=186 /DNA_ID=CAMNT_0028543253 /DNA_START=211 /DNA_END=771 /DNA_ORIENTATION=-